MENWKSIKHLATYCIRQYSPLNGKVQENRWSSMLRINSHNSFKFISCIHLAFNEQSANKRNQPYVLISHKSAPSGSSVIAYPNAESWPDMYSLSLCGAEKGRDVTVSQSHSTAKPLASQHLHYRTSRSKTPTRKLCSLSYQHTN